MPYTVVQDENELPLEQGKTITYIRLLSDPLLMQHGMSGEIFTRADGKEWRHDGYRIGTSKSGEREVTPRNRLA